MGVDVMAAQAADRSVVEHYRVAAHVVATLFGPIPFVWATRRPTSGLVYHGPLAAATKPKGPVVEVPLRSGVARYPRLTADRIDGLVAHGAIEIHSWTPAPGDPTHAAFARVLIGRTASTRVRTGEALLALRETLAADGMEAIPTTDAAGGAVLWIPLDDHPPYDAVRHWLSARCAEAVREHPDLVTLVPDSAEGPLLHLHVGTNAVGRFSMLPYSVRARPGLPYLTPLSWTQVESGARTGRDVASGDAASFPADLQRGEPFGDGLHAMGPQRFGGRGVPPTPVYAVVVPMPAKSHGHILAAAFAVLEDGHARSATQIRDAAVARGLLPAGTDPKYVYTALIEYIARTKGNGRRPVVVKDDADPLFRMNEPPDDWPEIAEPAAPQVPAEIAALIERLAATAAGSDAAAFEIAACDAFDALGFAATHLGGQKMPDGYADALLGPLGYRITIECKSGDEGINDPGVFEAAKFREPFGAQYSALVGRAFSGEVELVKELHNHGVSAWTVADLQTLLRLDADPVEMRPLFEPGFAGDALDDLLWERRHGRAKRVRIIAETLVRTAAATQTAERLPGDAPHLDEDAAMLLVDQDLGAQGSTARCSRDDVRAAIAYLENPLVAAVVRDASGGIVARKATCPEK